MKKRLDKKGMIAYLAPEIPAISEASAYSEILELEKQGLAMLPISVRKPDALAPEMPARHLVRSTSYLSALPLRHRMKNVAAMMRSRPGPFMRAFCLAMQDASSLRWLSRAPAEILSRFLAAATVARTLLLSGCSHVHAHTAHVPAEIAMYASLIARIPFSFTAHADDIFVQGRLLREKVQRSAFAVAISEFNRNFLLHMGVERRKVHVVHSGADTGLFTPREAREPGAPIRIGSLGRMVEKKGFDLLMDACRMLKIQDMPFILELAGDGPLKQDMVTRAYLKGLGKETVFLGAMSHDKVADWLRDLDVFVLACRKGRKGDMDGIPVVLMEAMLSGVPVVSTRVSGVPELIQDGVTGWLAERPDAMGLATALHAAILDGGVESGILDNAVVRIREDFDLAKNTMTLARLFQGESP
jgi:colanic acid/amylovoran biosynthesis glycosyltransferase